MVSKQGCSFRGISFDWDSTDLLAVEIINIKMWITPILHNIMEIHIVFTLNDFLLICSLTSLSSSFLSCLDGDTAFLLLNSVLFRRLLCHAFIWGGRFLTISSI